MSVSLLALTAFAGGSLLASAAPSPRNIGATYEESLSFADNPPIIFSVDSSALNAQTNFTLLSAAIQTDGSGKVAGVAEVRLVYTQTSVTVTNYVTNDDETITTNIETDSSGLGTGFSDFVTDVSGRISSSKSGTRVQLTFRGNGYSSTNANPDLPAAATFVVPARVNLRFTGDGTVAEDGTISGQLSGMLNPGIKSVNNGHMIRIADTAVLQVDLFSISNLVMDIVQNRNRFSAALSAPEDSSTSFAAIGNGSINAKKSTFTANFHGVGFNRGASLRLKGTTAPFNIGTTDEGLITVPNTPCSEMELTGRVFGQKVNATGGVATPLF
ncbi:MAG TPA: hypothetical protein VHH88_07965 [Verrucomicrobiae bacterium]|nr:hypothetical protein [Verrucomicrobiae bacterium]